MILRSFVKLTNGYKWAGSLAGARLEISKIIPESCFVTILRRRSRSVLLIRPSQSLRPISVAHNEAAVIRHMGPAVLPHFSILSDPSMFIRS